MTTIKPLLKTLIIGPEEYCTSDFITELVTKHVIIILITAFR